jgi:hypothetical protein
MGTVLLLVLLLLIIGSAPVYPHSRRWGYGPSGLLGLLLVVVLVLCLMGSVPWWGWTFGPAPGPVAPVR